MTNELEKQGEFEKLERPRVEALDTVLGEPFKVLDDGFVRVVDYMGSDESIVQAARVSYGKGTKKIHEDRGLIRYLMRHRHTTPFEMAEIKLHVRVPMDCWRQWIRHRTACLAEGTEIHFDLPGGIQRRGNQLYKLKIEDIWQRFQPTRNTQRPDKQRYPYFRRDRVRDMRLRQVNEETLRIQHTRIADVYKNGTKPVFRMKLEDGKWIEATADHRFLFEDGWKTLHQATGLHERGGKAIWNRGLFHLYINGMEVEAPAPYQDKAWLSEQYNELGLKIGDIAVNCDVSYHTIRKWIRKHGIQHEKGGRSEPPWNKGRRYRLGSRTVTPEWLEKVRQARSGPASNFWKGGVSNERENIGRWTTQVARKVHDRYHWTCQLCHQRAWNKLTVARLVRVVDFEYVGEKMTYDLEVEGPYHNFVANGVITHNSVNEYSTRYSIAIDATQQTPPTEWRKQAKGSRQGSEGHLDEEAGKRLSRKEQEIQDLSRTYYQERLEAGVAREQARKDLPLSTYTEAYWKIDLHNLLHFLSLRMDDHAQEEIREYARTIGEKIVAVWCPITWEAFLDYRMNATSLTRLDTEIIKAIAAGREDDAIALATEFGLLKRGEKGLKRNRERSELEAKLERLNLPIPWRG